MVKPSTYSKKMSMDGTALNEQINVCSMSTIQTLKKGVKYV